MLLSLSIWGFRLFEEVLNMELKALAVGPTVVLVFKEGPLVEEDLDPDLEPDLESDNSLFAVFPLMANLTNDLLDKICL